MSLKQQNHMKKLNANQANEDNRYWKGEKVGYKGLHQWVRNHLERPNLCSICNEKESREVANLDGKYSRDLKTWVWTCRSCHMRMDNVGNRAWITRRAQEHDLKFPFKKKMEIDYVNRN
jgi:hypothetical protein